VARGAPIRSASCGPSGRPRKQMHAIAREWETELALLQDDLHEIAGEYRQRLDVEQAIVERTMMAPETLLH
jgi:hypothetical protein